jgi:hypothetical protein
MALPVRERETVGMATNHSPLGAPLVSIQRASVGSLVDGHLCSGVLLDDWVALLVPPVPDELSRPDKLPSGFRVVAGASRLGGGQGWVVSAPVIKIEVMEQASGHLTAIVVKAGPPGLGDAMSRQGMNSIAEMEAGSEQEAWQLLSELHQTAGVPDSAWLSEADRLLRGQQTASPESDSPANVDLDHEDDGGNAPDGGGNAPYGDDNGHEGGRPRTPRGRPEPIPPTTWYCRYLHIGCPD